MDNVLEFHGYVLKVNDRHGVIYTPTNNENTAIFLMNDQIVATFKLNTQYGENKVTVDTDRRLILEGNIITVLP